jgi:hypothetical protein
VDTPDGPRQAMWRNQRFPDDAPGFPALFSCGHLTPELIYRREWMAHPNGALGVTEIIMVHPEPGAMAVGHARLVGTDNVRLDPDGLTANWGATRFRILSPSGAANRFPGVKLPSVPPEGRLIGAAVAVASLRMAGTILDRNGIAAARTTSGGIVPLGVVASAVIIEFRES